MKIIDMQGENVGKVKDIMLDSTGTVRYVIVSYDCFLDVCDKQFVVPMEAFQVKRESDMFFTDVKLILNVNKERLEKRNFFDGTDWLEL